MTTKGGARARGKQTNQNDLSDPETSSKVLTKAGEKALGEL